MKSFDKFFEFIKRSNAISPTIALETATALQVMLLINEYHYIRYAYYYCLSSADEV